MAEQEKKKIFIKLNNKPVNPVKIRLKTNVVKEDASSSGETPLKNPSTSPPEQKPFEKKPSPHGSFTTVQRPFDRNNQSRGGFSSSDGGAQRPFDRNNQSRGGFSPGGGSQRPFDRNNQSRGGFSPGGGAQRPFDRNNQSRGGFSPGGGSQRPFDRNNQSRGGFSPGGGAQRPFDRNNQSRGGFSPGGGQRPGSSSFSQPSNTSEFQKNTKRVKADPNKKKKGFDKFDKAENAFELNTKKQLVNPIPSQIEINETILVSELARKMNLKAATLISKLMELGFAATINDALDSETAEILASDFDCQVIVKSHDEELNKIILSLSQEDSVLSPRPPIVTIMGHVDHGKTTLLDYIRKTHVVKSESGGITQHIGAYQIEYNSHKITFIDTPGHAAFTQMRARGSSITDIVILVVAADDGIMPQTIEALNHAKAAKVPIIVAINKIDKASKSLDVIKTKLSELDLLPEEWGGDTIFTGVSALQGTNIDKLLDSILLTAEMLDIKAGEKRLGKGIILESKMDKNRGSSATIIVQDGTIHKGDLFVSGVSINRIKALFNHLGEEIKLAPPSTPVEILGFEGVPEAGSFIHIINNDKVGKEIIEKKKAIRQIEHAKKIKKTQTSLDDIYDQIKEKGKTEFNVIIKADVQGTAEAIQGMLEKLASQIEEVNLKVIHSAVGAITENDILLASTSNALVIGFNVRVNNDKANRLAKEKNVEIRRYSIIYEITNDIKDAIEGVLKPEKIESTLGEFSVKQVFKIPKIGLIAGGMVIEGTIKINASVRVIREGMVLFTGKIQTLKRLKEDVKEVKKGFECGVHIHNFHDIKPEDILEVYEIKEKSRKLQLIETSESNS